MERKVKDMIPELAIDNTISEEKSIIKKKDNKKSIKDGKVYKFPSKHRGKQKGDKASPLKTLEEITAVIKYYENKANDESTRKGYEQIADRNKLFCVTGFNVGVRASDLVKIKWTNVYDSNGNFLEPDEEDVDDRRTTQIVEQKTQKVKNLIFSDIVKDAFTEYVDKYNIDKSSSDYVFFSRQKSDNGENHISVEQASNIIKEAAKVCGIKRRVASHTFRKTYALWQMRGHQDDAMFTAELMDLLNHDSEEATLHYVGLDIERRIQYHNDVQLGKVSVIREHKKVEVNHDKEVIVDKYDLEYLLKQLSEKCYTCSNECGTCYNAMIAKKYGCDLNTI